MRGLLGQEKRRLAKVIGTAPLHDYVIGQGEGELPVRKLRMTLMRLPRALSPQGRQRARQAAQGADGAAADAQGRGPEEHAAAARRVPADPGSLTSGVREKEPVPCGAGSFLVRVSGAARR